MHWRAKTLLASLALGGLLSLALSATASASTTTTQCTTGQCGEHSTTWASCDTTVQPSVQVHAPTIKSSVVTYPANQMVWPNHTQWVGFRSWLLRYNSSTRTWDYTDQNRDGYFDHGALFKAQVVNGNLWDPPSSWYNVDAGRWESGTAFLPVRFSGYYRVLTNYYWSADQLSAGGSDQLVQTADYFVSTGVTVIGTPWCQFS